MPTIAAADIRNAPPQHFLDDGPAACREVDPELFFPNPGDDSSYVKQVCRHCEIQRGCRAWAMPVKGLSGIWGGLTAQERDFWRRKGRS